MRSGLALALTLALAGTAAAQDVVKLKNGKYLAGTVVIDDADKDGFKVKRWDTGGTVTIKWSQVSEVERRRLTNKPAESGPTGELLDGVRIITSNRELVGLVEKETEREVYVKTKENPTAALVPKSAILSRAEIKVRESDAYSAEEMVNRRLSRVDPKDAGRLIEVARFAISLKQYAKAKELVSQAAAADASKKDECDTLLAQLEGLIKESEAGAKLAAIRKLVEETKFDEALAEAEKFLSGYGDTTLGVQNRDLVAQLKKEKEEYEKNRGDFLAKKVPDAWKSQRSSLLSEYAKTKYKLSDARSNVSKMDEEIRDRLAKKFNCPPEDIETAWGKREPKKKTVDMGTGSWIYKGGQDGGMDYLGGGDAKEEDPVDDFVRRFGGKKKPGEKKEEPGKKLQTSDEWWAAASQSTRHEWLETEYAINSGYCKKDAPVEKKCSSCSGKGTIKTTRLGKPAEVVCGRCHKCAVDVSVAYW